jgi:peptidoglycan hydrolase-like protein with peptidoglycan-binding domain
MQASTRADRGSRSLGAATLTCVLALACAWAPQALAAGIAGPGGTAPGALLPTPSAPTSAPAGGEAASSSGTPSRHVRSVRIVRASCVPVARCSSDPHQVTVHGTLLLSGIGLRSGLVVAFPARAGARISRASPAARLRLSRIGLTLTVPMSAHSGRIGLLLSGGRYTSSFGPISIFRHALHPPAPPPPPVPASTGGAPSASAFDGQGMWIWYVSRSSGGSVAAIVAQAHAGAVSTVFVKSSDGASNYWSQFSPQLVAELHANGLKVCAWQYVYGSNPVGEAALGARAVANGADCLVIDAEAEYEGRYAAAQSYIAELRAKIGPLYPLGLASFPYVSYHGAFPYSVFLGPGAAQYNAPQMYWKDIGVSVDTVYANTYIANRIYGRPIFPLGQTYGGVSSHDLLRFREEAVDYGATGVSFWDWQETPASGWQTLAAPLAPLSSVTPNGEYPEVHRGSKGDQVLWLQEHLASAAPAQETTGIFGAQTVTNLSAFQSAHGIPPNAVADPATWAALLALPPVAVSWTGGGPSG